jgi:hypothetical protein
MNQIGGIFRRWPIADVQQPAKIDIGKCSKGIKWRNFACNSNKAVRFQSGNRGENGITDETQSLNRKTREAVWQMI